RCFFFFQAEDGIRDFHVTGVQTCALPISKTDKKDAMMIAEYGKTEQPSLWESDSDYVLELKQMQAYLEQLNKNRTGFIRQKEAFKHNSVSSSVVGMSMDSVLDKIEQEIKEIESRMEAIIRIHHQEMFDQLTSIPGLGK